MKYYSLACKNCPLRQQCDSSTEMIKIARTHHSKYNHTVVQIVESILEAKHPKKQPKPVLDMPVQRERTFLEYCDVHDAMHAHGKKPWHKCQWHKAQEAKAKLKAALAQGR